MSIPNHVDPENPFPLLNSQSHTYAEAQQYSTLVDHFLGFNIVDVEFKLKLKAQSDFEKREQWIGLDPAALLTPYSEIRALLHLLESKKKFALGQRVIDLGAGYGRMAFVIGKHYPTLHFTGYEISKERVREANRVLQKFNYPHVEVLEQDLSKMSFIIPPADIFFIYDFGTLNSIKKALLDLQNIARTKPITVVGRGRACRDQIERQEPWLSQVQTPEHHGNFSIYRSGE